MQGLVNVAAGLLGVWGLLQWVAAAFYGLFFLGFGGLGLISGESDGVIMGVMMGGLGVVLAGIYVVSGLAQIIGAYGVFSRASWGRVAGFIGGAASLMSLLTCGMLGMVGVIIGILTIVVLVDKEVAAEFSPSGGF